MRIARNVRIGERTRMQNHSIMGAGAVVEADCSWDPASP